MLNPMCKLRKTVTLAAIGKLTQTKLLRNPEPFTEI